jgi:hypothetical protein
MCQANPNRWAAAKLGKFEDTANLIDRAKFMSIGEAWVYILWEVKICVLSWEGEFIRNTLLMAKTHGFHKVVRANAVTS